MSGAVRAGDSHCGASGLKLVLGAGKSQLRRVIDSAVVAVFEVDAHDLQASTRGSPRAAFARQVAMYLAHVVCGLVSRRWARSSPVTGRQCPMPVAWSKTGATTPT
jgi:hypothetical protein